MRRIASALALAALLALFATASSAVDETAAPAPGPPADDLRADILENARDIRATSETVERSREEIRDTRARLEAAVEALRADFAALAADTGAKVDEAAAETRKRAGANRASIEANARALEEAARELAQARQALSEAIDANGRALQASDALVSQTRAALAELDSAAGRNESVLDHFWLLMAALLVLFTQAGFAAFEVGVVRGAHAGAVGVKSLLVWMLAVIVYFAVGFGLMFGPPAGGFAGGDLFMPSPAAIANAGGGAGPGLEFLLFQTVLAATAAAIVSRALADRATLFATLMAALFVAALVYPAFGHWAWGGALGGGKGWLQALGFRDFAGATGVHSLGAWVAWVAIARAGARPGRFRAKRARRPLLAALLVGEPDRVNRRDFQPDALGSAVLGVFLVWFGWWGFTGGSLMRYADALPSILLATSLAGAAGGLTGFFLAFYLDRDNLWIETFGGALGGLVAIAACADVATVGSAMGIGLGAGLVFHLGANFLLWCGHDDPVGAIPVHGFCGVFGTLCAALPGGPLDAGGAALGAWLAGAGIASAGLARLLTQGLGIAVCAAFAGGSAWIFLRLLGARRAPAPDEGEPAGGEALAAHSRGLT